MEEMHERRSHNNISNATSSSNTATSSSSRKPLSSSNNQRNTLVIVLSVFLGVLLIFFFTSSSSSTTISTTEHNDDRKRRSASSESKISLLQEQEQQQQQKLKRRRKRRFRTTEATTSENDNREEQHHQQQQQQKQKEVGFSIQSLTSSAKKKLETSTTIEPTTTTTTTKTTIQPKETVVAETSSTFDFHARAYCVDIDPVKTSRRDMKILDSYLLTRFHACQLRRVWILGSYSSTGESRGQQMIMFPPSLTKKELLRGVPTFDRAKFDFPTTPFNTRFTFIVEQQDEFVERRERKLVQHQHQRDQYGRRHRSNYGNNYNNNNNNNVDEQHLPVVPGVTLLIPPHYCCSHPVHFSEHHSALERSLARWLLPQEKHNNNISNSENCPGNENEKGYCFRTIDRVLVYSSKGVTENSFNYHTIRVLLFGAFRRAGYSVEAALHIPITSISGKNQLYDKLIVPGSLYDIYPTTELGVQYRKDFRDYFYFRKFNELAVTKSKKINQNSHQQQQVESVVTPINRWGQIYMTAASSSSAKKSTSTEEENRKNIGGEDEFFKQQNNNNTKSKAKLSTKKKITIKEEGKNKEEEEEKEEIRKIVFFNRNSGRTIVDSTEFVEFLSKIANLVDAEVVSIKAGEVSPDDLFEELSETKIAVGVHGADLSNMLFLHPTDSIMIEINPLFFFEPRFMSLANKLNYTYFAFNCYSPLCAFGGNSVQFKANTMDSIRYDPNTHEITSLKNSSFTIKWPAIGYVGEPEVCGKPCLSMIHDTGLIHKFFTHFRSSNVKMCSRLHLSEMAEILWRSFLKLNWIEKWQKRNFEEKVKLMLERYL